MRTALRIIWTLACITVAAGLLGGLLGLKFRSWPLAIVGAVVGIPAGWIFARLVSPVDFFLETMD